MTKSLKILIVEDVEIAAKATRFMLLEFCSKIDLASTGEAAINSAMNHDYDMIFMDIGLPDMDGLEVTRRLRVQEAEGTHVPIVALTGHSAAEKKLDSLAAGMDDFYRKPLTKAIAKEIIDKHLVKKSNE